MKNLLKNLIHLTVLSALIILPSSFLSADENDLVIKEGSNVRVIREPFFGKIGIVKQLPMEPYILESETKALVSDSRM